MLLYIQREARAPAVRACAANLANYAAGTIIGAWFDMAETTAEEITAAIGEGETIILDYEAPDEMHIDEYENITNLIEFAQRLAELDEDLLNAMLYSGYTIEEAIGKIEGGDYNIYEDCDTMEDVAFQVVEDQGLLYGAPELAQRYFDYTGFGRDIEIKGHFYKTENGYIEIIS